MDVIFDIDGTLANLEHRRNFIASKPKNYKAFYAGMSYDLPIQPVIDVLKRLRKSGCRIILCSGRPDNYRVLTEEWCLAHDIEAEGLYMRRANDFRGDDIIKQELLDQIMADGFDPQIVFDDRSRVVAMWRKNGLICAQVDEGNF